MIPGATGFVDRRSERWQEGPHTASDMITSEAARITLRTLASSPVLEARLSFLPRAHNGVKTLGKRHQRTVVGPNELNLDKLPFSCTCGLIPLARRRCGADMPCNESERTNCKVLAAHSLLQRLQTQCTFSEAVHCHRKTAPGVYDGVY